MNYLKIKADNDRIFAEGGFEMRSEYFENVPITENPRAARYNISENLLPLTTTECILQNKGRKILALNFANANFPGGAYTMGGNAQEEALCRCSLLYYTIKECGEYYNKNRLHILPDYTDGIIISENVPVIRDDSGQLLDEPVMCGFITCPAVNRRLALPVLGDRKITEIMKRRIEKIICLAASKKPDIVILGAFGCGVFGNKRKTVFPLFEQAITDFGGECEFVFAVPD